MLGFLPPESGATYAQDVARQIPAEDMVALETLEAAIAVGARTADATLYEFFDYNCSYCQKSASALPALLKTNPGLRYVLVNFAVLGEDSITATRLALAFARQKPDAYVEFHMTLFQSRGTATDAALAAALSLGADEKRLMKDANSQSITAAMIATVTIADRLGLNATPSYIGGNSTIVGFLDPMDKQQIVTNLRQCNRMACG